MAELSPRLEAGYLSHLKTYLQPQMIKHNGAFNTSCALHVFKKQHKSQLKYPPPDGIYGIMCLFCPKVFLDRWDLEEHEVSDHWGRIPTLEFEDIKQGKYA